MKILLSLTLVLSVEISHAQTFRKFDSILTKQLSRNQNHGEGGIWVYYRKSANIQTIRKPEVSKLLPNFKFYKLNLTNYLDEHVESSRCLVLFDTVNTRILLAEPMWNSDQNETFLKLFIGKKFKDRNTLMKFIAELQDLLIVGFDGTFVNTKYYDTKVNFDLRETDHGKGDIWRKVEIAISVNAITSFKLTNPTMNESRIVQ